MCGVTSSSTTAATKARGLSPRVRGHLKPARLVGVHERSIPACAGSPDVQNSIRRANKVYPRVCGVTSVRPSWLYPTVGLSPRVRGHRRSIYAGMPYRGSIPACAGSPCPGLRARTDRGVYPRVCGVTDSKSSLGGASEGLSPRVRGHLADNLRLCRSRGSIPACAGSPVSYPVGFDMTEVYPRVCGVTSTKAWTNSFRRGLSPRVRGHP